MAENQVVTSRIALTGIVQGVGFRPFVARLAAECHIRGTVRNAMGEVEIDAFGTPGDLDRFVRALREKAPPGSDIQGLRERREALAPGALHPEGFRIVQSHSRGGGPVMPTPDLAICDDCVRELFTPGDPRFENPFISCTNCGPRYSIMRRAPYDRDNTAMGDFPMCPLCGGQYADPGDRRYHAQTVCCNACGPRLFYDGREGCAEDGGALSMAVDALTRGGIVAVKGIGGYHFTCSPFDGDAVSRLRALKGRERKPFAVMFSDMAALEAHCEVSAPERALLEGPARPIVLLRRTPSSGISPEVYADSGDLGAFLPYTPLQHLLLRRTGPLVMTSANVSSLPIIKDDAEALDIFHAREGLAGVLRHDRAILRRLDDSVAAVARGQAYSIRRARGVVPAALRLPGGGPPLIALGSQQKNTICLYKDGYAYPSAEIGDLDSRETLAVYRETIADMESLLGIAPEFAVCDMHPGYESTAIAKALGLPLLPVQHHHAHIASVMAEHSLTGPVIGVALDGTGYGTDGTVWGGEFLIVSPEGCTRAGHLKPVAMLGSDESVRQGWKSAACMLRDAGIPARDGDARAALVQAALAHGVNTIRSSSMGRAFDAASALLSICQESTYDGQGAIELENAAMRHVRRGGRLGEPLPFDVLDEDGRLVADLAPCFRALHACAEGGGNRDALAWRFHATVSGVIEAVCAALSERHGIRAVALSGGVFLNRLLVEYTVPRLEKLGFAVYRNRQVPPGDGGVSLGQACIGVWSKR